MKGRTAQPWGRDRSMRWDTGTSTVFRFTAPVERGGEPVTNPDTAILPGRRGYAERDLTVMRPEDTHILVALNGWYTDTLTLNERQARFLRDTLARWFPD